MGTGWGEAITQGQSREGTQEPWPQGWSFVCWEGGGHLLWPGPVVGIAPFHSCILPLGSEDEMSHPRSSSGVRRREMGRCVCRRGTGGQRDRQSGPVREAQALVLSSWAKRAWPPSCEGFGDAANTSRNTDGPKRPLEGLAHGARGLWLRSPSAWGLVVKPAQALCTSDRSGEPQ